MKYLKQYKVDKLLELLFSSIDVDAFGKNFKKAYDRKDTDAMVHEFASYYRKRPDCKIKSFCGERKYDKQKAHDAVRGIMCEVNVDYAFPNNEVDFLYNPTEKIGTLNHEWLWQFNRHGYWIDMACDYLATGDKEYVKVFNDHIQNWVMNAECPDPWNAPYSAWRTIECGIRLMHAWQIAFEIFRHDELFEDISIALMVVSMYQQAMHLVKNPTSGNWLLMEYTGAYTFAALFPEFKDANAIRKQTSEVMSNELEAQFLPDGYHYELSPDYHSVAYNCYSSFYSVAKQLGYESELPNTFSDILYKAAIAYIEMATPRLTQPRTNDCYTLDTAVVTKFATEIFDNVPEFEYINSNRKSGKPLDGTPSKALPYAGFFIMRNDWSDDSAYLCFDNGPIGMGHEHMDKLNINIYKGKDELIFDDGAGHYDVSDTRKYGLSGYDHNEIIVDGKAQRRGGPRKYDEPIDTHWITNDEFDYACGTYDDGFGESEEKLAKHFREVRFCKPGFFIIHDKVTSRDDKPHDYDLLFHVDTTKVDSVKEFDKAILTDLGKTYDALIVPLNCADEAIQTATAQKEPRLYGWYVGRNESTLHPATTIIRSATGKKDYEFTTLIFPTKRDDSKPTIVQKDNMLEITFEGKAYRIDLNNLDK